jgi:ubiquinone/menaquinone biosynthesis C-methylase UbiE
MGFYEQQVLPRVIDKLLGTRGFHKLRRRVAEGLSGEVLEVGFGSGLNVPHYPNGVERVFAVDPATVGRDLAEKRLRETDIPVEFVGLDGEHLPLDDASVDHVLTTWTLCTIPHVELALAEMVRVLRPGGRLHFLEHGHSPDPKVARWQRRLDPLQQRIAGGCHLARPIDELVEQAGFRIESLGNYYLTFPKSMGYMYEGQAVAP